MTGSTVEDRQFQQAHDFVEAMWAALEGDPKLTERVEFTGGASLASCFACTDLWSASYATAALAVSELVAHADAGPPGVTVDRILASDSFPNQTRAVNGVPRHRERPELTTDYATRDGRFIRFQANYLHLKENIVRAIGVGEDIDAIRAAIAERDADDIEQQIVDGGGTVAASRTVEEWYEHPQGKAVAAEPLADITLGDAVVDTWRPTPTRPLAGVRVLDMTRILAGPMGTRFLAGFGAEVLRLDPPGYEEPGGSSGGELTQGKRCARLDLRIDADRARWLELLAGADVLIHGYRPGVLDSLGLTEEVRKVTRSGLVEVTLDAYGWTGPWAARRGFDTLLQSSTGISTATGAWLGLDTPHVMPSQVLDHGTGYLVAAATVRGLTRRLENGQGSRTRLALARTAHLLIQAGRPPEEQVIELPVQGPLDERTYAGLNGPIRRLRWPVEIENAPFFWERHGDPYGSSVAMWVTSPNTGRAA
jgi:hypothetical protein